MSDFFGGVFALFFWIIIIPAIFMWTVVAVNFYYSPEYTSYSLYGVLTGLTLLTTGKFFPIIINKFGNAASATIAYRDIKKKEQNTKKKMTDIINENQKEKEKFSADAAVSKLFSHFSDIGDYAESISESNEHNIEIDAIKSAYNDIINDSDIANLLENPNLYYSIDRKARFMAINNEIVSTIDNLDKLSTPNRVKSRIVESTRTFRKFCLDNLS